MYKYAKMLRNAALLLSFYLFFWEKISDNSLSMYGAVTSGLALLTLQIIVGVVGKNMMQSYKHRNDEPLRRGLMVGGLSVDSDCMKGIFSKFNTGKKIKTLSLVGVVILTLAAVHFGLGFGDSESVLLMLIGATIHLMISPISKGLSEAGATS